MAECDVSHRALQEELTTCRRRIAELEDRLAAQASAHAQDCARFERLFENAPMGYQSLDEQGNFLEVNRAWLDTLGYTRDEVLGKNFAEFLPLEWQDHFRQNFPRFKALGEILGVEFEMVRKDGSTIQVAFNGRIGRDPAGNFKQTHCIFDDVTLRRRTEEALRESEERYRQVVNTMRETLSVLTPDGKFLFVNDRAAANLSGGLGPEAVIGRNIRDFTPPDQAQALLEMYQQVHHSQRPLVAEVRVDMAGGEKWFHNTTLPIRYGRDRQSCVLSMSLDITERKQAQLALQGALDRLSFHVDNSPLGVVEWENGRNISFWSRQAEAIFGWSAEEVQGKNWDDFAFVHPEDAEGVTEIVSRLFQGLESFNSHQNRNFRKDGRVIHCQWHNSVLRDASGKVLSLLSLVADVTQLQEALANLAQARELAEAASRAKSEFLANMSHEIRTPLNGLLGMLQLLSAGELNAEQHEYVDLAITSSKRLTRLLSDILDISQIEAGKMPILNEVFHLSPALEQVVELFLPTARQLGVDLRLDLDPALPKHLVGDACRLQQVLINLVGNALKYTTAGHVTIHAMPLASRPDGPQRVLFSVEDTGCGIADAVISQLFEPFSQATQGFRRTHQGAGLGLSICKRLVTLMGGHISVESEPERGATFHFTIAFSRSTSNAAPPEAPAPVAATGRQPLRILLAEDEPINRIVATTLLERQGFRVTTVENGQQVLEALQRTPVDLILMDVQMPMLSGVEATEAIRRGDAGQDRRNVPILAMTAYAMADEQDAFKAAGMNGCIAKPLELHTLLRAVWTATQPREA